MASVETFAERSGAPGHLSRRRLIQVFAATLAATQLVGTSAGGTEAAAAVAVPTASPPAYGGIVGLL